jgi:hypothetical protein
LTGVPSGAVTESGVEKYARYVRLDTSRRSRWVTGNEPTPSTRHGLDDHVAGWTLRIGGSVPWTGTCR